MGRKKVLEKRKQRLIAKKDELKRKSDKSEDINELRMIHEQLQGIEEDLRETEEELDELDETGEQEKGEGNEEERQEREGRNEETRGGNPLMGYGSTLGSFPQNSGQERNKDPYDTMEYREAFMEFVCRGTPIPATMQGEMPKEFRDAEVTLTSDTSAVIPTTIANGIIRELDGHGNVWAQVRKLNVTGGLEIPILTLKPTAKWVGESTTSEDQKVKADEKIVFSYYGIECKIAQSILTNVTTLKAFQDLFVPLAAEAMVTAIEIAIFSGNGSGKPMGILNDTRVKAANKITLKPSEFGKWDVWKKKVFAKMKKAYRKGTFWMNQSTFDGYIDGMVDANGQPIGRVNYGIEGEEKYRFGGKKVETVDDDILKGFDEAQKDEVVAVFIDMKNYVVNSNMSMVTIRWTDHDDNKIKDKVMMIVDGKLADANGVLIIKKGEEAAA